MNPNDVAWTRLRGQFTPADDEVHVWLINQDLFRSDLRGLRLVLSSDEQEKADRFRAEGDRRRSVIARACLRLLLGGILNVSPKSLSFAYERFGKPRLRSVQEERLRFNVAHSAELVLIAIARGREVGVDVERIRTDIDLDEVASRFFSADECRSLASLSYPGRYEAFFTCWTRKEAYLKARGDGLSRSLDQFDVSLLPGEEARVLATRHDPSDASRWRLTPVGTPLGYVATLAAEGSDWKLKGRNWPSGSDFLNI